ncbi:Uncharacterized membrane protein [Paracoccus isoporae]|uniref:Uncharacterized membrane protein n=1 Tax=Paracoccus isoporae TaxID=591205 RepID=A0A1G6ZL24_9RHOB|nr:DUF2270 domain-containing protein [Paracoccus isoporae]SDE02545.1 Uncharacterized membrane protein [Paracoccus isoporae]
MNTMSSRGIHGDCLPENPHLQQFSAAEMGAIAHLYRGEVYRSTMWRSRLDTTTNWTVVLTGVSLTAVFGSASASPLPLILVGPLVAVFLLLEARRYRYFNVWRARARLLETDFYAPMLRGQHGGMDGRWNALLADDYDAPRFHISYVRAVGRRLRKNYIWVFMMQALTYFGKIFIHPTPATSMADAFAHARIGPVSGQLVIAAGAAFHAFWIMLALVTYLMERRVRRRDQSLIAM